MNLTVAAFLIATMSLNAAGPGDIAGNWEAKYVSGVAWKTIGSAEFEFRTDGDKLTGIAHIATIAIQN